MVLPLVACLEAEVLAVSPAYLAVVFLAGVSPAVVAFCQDLEATVGKEDSAATVVMVALVHVWLGCCAVYAPGAFCDDTCNTD